MSDETQSGHAALATRRRDLQRHEPSQDTLDILNALLVTCSCIGAYALGIVCADAWALGEEPTFDQLLKASNARRLA